MYTHYFGLSERPFSIAPNPDYLFMGDRHQEALNHLTYGLGDTGGFVLLTGEVGTGKTTISRRLMENLPENTQAAFILNPTLSSQELLATLCDELKIRYRKTGATLKTLTDKIQEKLLKNHAAHINTLLIIDEAQHLQPEVLEQLRLLTNLETNTKKLLQVILIGQPELQQLLQRRDLRQLAQRITARYHLLPLNKQEVEQYLKHRLSVANCFRNLFDPSAVKAIHQTCKGIPRLMNLLADRALMNAYNSNNAVVNRKIVLQAAQDALGSEYQVVPWWQMPWLKLTSIIILLAIFLSVGIWLGTKNTATTASALVTKTSEPIKLNLTDPATMQVTPEKVALETQIVEKNNVSAIDQASKIEQLQAELTKQKLLLANKIATDIPTKVTPINKLRSTPNDQQKVRSNSDFAVIGDQKVIKNNNITQDSSIQKPDDMQEFTVKATDGVSDKLLASFQSAIAETNQPEINQQTEHSGATINSLMDMPAWVQDGIPAITFEMHLYASDGKGWVRVNGRDRYEGDYIARELLLNEIRPQEVVLSFRGEKFTMAALSSWN